MLPLPYNYAFFNDMPCSQRRKNELLKKKAATKVKLSLANAIDLTGAKSVARQTHDALSEANKEAANHKIEKTMKSKMNRPETYL